MTYSIFNTYLPIEEGVQVIYNAFSDKFAIIKSEEPIYKISPEKLKHDTYVKLKKAGIILSKDIDELKNLENLINSTDFEDSSYQIHINPTLDCNFKCWYCYETHQQGSKMSNKTISSVTKLIDKIIQKPNIKNLKLSFFGGEPLLGYKNCIVPLIEKTQDRISLTNMSFSIHITTNGYLLTPEMIRFLKGFRTSLQITLDGSEKDHNEVRFTHKNKPSYRHILSNALNAVSNNIDVILRINYTSKNIQEMYELIDDLSNISNEAKKRLHVNFQRVWQDSSRHIKSNDPVVTKQLDYITTLLKNGISTSTHLYPTHVSKSCYGDKHNYALINYNGDVFKCSARDFNKKNRMGDLDEFGNIKWYDEKINLWETSKLIRASCRKCFLAPMCGSGCRQNSMEQLDEEHRCVYADSKESKIELIKIMLKLQLIFLKYNNNQ